MMFIRIIF